MTLLEITDLQVRYGAVLGVENVSIQVDTGRAVALLGANGAGKSTVLRAIGGLLPFHRGRVTRGDITFDGRSLLGKSADANVAAGIGQCLEGRRIFSGLTVLENLTLGAFNPRAKKHVAQSIKDACELFPRLGERLQQVAGTLSGGEQQMLAIARGLAARPRVLMLDEPSLGLAPIIVQEIGSALRRISAEGTAILLVDQSTSLALHAAQSAYLIETGRTTAYGPTAELLSDDTVRASYLGTSGGRDLVKEEVESA